MENLKSTEQLLYCSKCGSTDVRKLLWVNPNTGTKHEPNIYSQTTICNDCHCYGQLLSYTELLQVIEDWRIRSIMSVRQALIGSLAIERFNGYYDSATSLWNTLTDEQKIETWRRFK